MPKPTLQCFDELCPTCNLYSSLYSRAQSTLLSHFICIHHKFSRCVSSQIQRQALIGRPERNSKVRESESEAGRGGIRMRRLKIWRLVVFPSQSVLCKTEPDGGKLLSSSALRARQYAFRRYGGFDSTTKDTRQTLHHAKAARLSESKNFRRAAT